MWNTWVGGLVGLFFLAGIPPASASTRLHCDEGTLDAKLGACVVKVLRLAVPRAGIYELSGNKVTRPAISIRQKNGTSLGCEEGTLIAGSKQCLVGEFTARADSRYTLDYHTGSITSPARSRLGCDDYAVQVVALAQKSAELQCVLPASAVGPVPITWEATASVHDGWCRANEKVSDEQLLAALAKRKGLIDTCAQARTASLQRCGAYAETAVRAQKANEALRCGLNGKEWSSDLDAHKAACVRAMMKPELARDLLRENEGRIRQLRDCVQTQLQLRM